MDYAEVRTMHLDTDCSALICSGVLDDWALGYFQDRLEPVALFARDVVVDLRQVSFIDMLILQQIITATKVIRARQGTLCVFVTEGTHPCRVLRTTGLDKVLDVKVFSNLVPAE